MQMHSLQVLKHAAQAALSDDDEEGDPADLSLFRAVVDPGSVLGMIDLIERQEAEIVAMRAALVQMQRKTSSTTP